MVLRYLKVSLIGWIALLCLFYAIQNVVNLEACYQAFAYVVSGADHQVYGSSFMPRIESPGLIWLMLIIVVGFEFLAGFIAAKGCWDLWSARRGTGRGFNEAKTNALLGSGLVVFIWMGLFGVLGGALFQMWQTEIGSNSMDDAFQFAVFGGLIFLIINSVDE